MGHTGRIGRAVIAGVILTAVGIVLALAVGPGFWALVVAGVLTIALALAVALARAIRPALRPQEVKYDHGWLTNVLGDTSTPHETDRPRERE